MRIILLAVFWRREGCLLRWERRLELVSLNGNGPMKMYNNVNMNKYFRLSLIDLLTELQKKTDFELHLLRIISKSSH